MDATTPIQRFFDEGLCIATIVNKFNEEWVDLMVNPRRAAEVAFEAIAISCQHAMDKADNYRIQRDKLADIRDHHLEEY